MKYLPDLHAPFLSLVDIDGEVNVRGACDRIPRSRRGPERGNTVQKRWRIKEEGVSC
jgi:hypothetical protein